MILCLARWHHFLYLSISEYFVYSLKAFLRDQPLYDILRIFHEYFARHTNNASTSTSQSIARGEFLVVSVNNDNMTTDSIVRFIYLLCLFYLRVAFDSHACMQIHSDRAVGPIQSPGQIKGLYWHTCSVKHARTHARVYTSY